MLPRSTRGSSPDRSRWNCAFSRSPSSNCSLSRALCSGRPAATAAGEAAAASPPPAWPAAPAGRSASPPDCSAAATRPAVATARCRARRSARAAGCQARQRPGCAVLRSASARDRALGAEAQRAVGADAAIERGVAAEQPGARERDTRPLCVKSTMPRAASNGGPCRSCTRKSLPASCRLPLSVAAGCRQRQLALQLELAGACDAGAASSAAPARWPTGARRRSAACRTADRAPALQRQQFLRRGEVGDAAVHVTRSTRSICPPVAKRQVLARSIIELAAEPGHRRRPWRCAGGSPRLALTAARPAGHVVIRVRRRPGSDAELAPAQRGEKGKSEGRRERESSPRARCRRALRAAR